MDAVYGAAKGSRHYNWTMIDPGAKTQRRKVTFPEGQKKAFALGSQIVHGAWEE